MLAGSHSGPERTWKSSHPKVFVCPYPIRSRGEARFADTRLTYLTVRARRAANLPELPGQARENNPVALRSEAGREFSEP